MTPREVDELSPAEYRALVLYANADVKAQIRAMRKRR